MPIDMLTLLLSNVILRTTMELFGPFFGLSMAAVTMIVVGGLWTVISKCPECGSMATRAIEVDPRIRICRKCYSLYKTGPQ
jgi:predicted membrane metal-binding protein